MSTTPRSCTPPVGVVVVGTMRWWRAGLALTVVPAQVLAHAILTKTSLDGAPLRSDTATTVTLYFNAGIEQRLAKVTLVDAKGVARDLEVTPGTAPGEVTVALPPLAAGAYGLRYKVLAADGHVTENVRRFTVTPAP